MRILTRWILFGALAFAPRALLAQEIPSARPQVDSILLVARDDSVIGRLGERFLYEIDLLAPDLSLEQRALLSAAVMTGFDPSSVREDVARAMAADASPPLATDLLERHRTGAIGELERLARAYQPPQTLTDFIANIGTPPRERIQLMVALAEAQGRGTFQLSVEESLEESAHALLSLLGARLGPFERMTSERFAEVYRQRSLRLGLENLYRLGPIPDDVVQRAIESLQAESGQWYVTAFATAMRGAVQAAAGRVAALTVVAPEPPAAPAPPADPGLPCMADTCGFIVDWDGPESTAYNLRFGAAGALGAHVLENLGKAGVQLAGGIYPAGLTITLRPRLKTVICDVMSGTDTSTCEAIGEVRVEFRGKYGERENPTDFSVRNQCGSDGVLDINGIASLVAARIHYALTTAGDERSAPHC